MAHGFYSQELFGHSGNEVQAPTTDNSRVWLVLFATPQEVEVCNFTCEPETQGSGAAFVAAPPCRQPSPPNGHKLWPAGVGNCGVAHSIQKIAHLKSHPGHPANFADPC